MKNLQIKLPIINEGDFLDSINGAIAEGRHVDYLEGVLRDYEWYKNEFSYAFTNQQPADAVYLFRATYLLKKQIWRELEMFGGNTFNE